MKPEGTSERRRALIIGYGNPLRADDGLGWQAAHQLSAESGQPRIHGPESFKESVTGEEAIHLPFVGVALRFNLLDAPLHRRKLHLQLLR